MVQIFQEAGFYTKGRPLVKSNLICPLDKLSWQPGCPVLNINIQGTFCISQGNGSSDNLSENLSVNPWEVLVNVREVLHLSDTH